MAYSDSVKRSVLKAPKTLGNQLGRYAIHLDIPVTFVAKATGATRQTVYNWFNGGEVLQPYRASVTSILKIAQTSPTFEDARRKICTAFNLSA